MWSSSFRVSSCRSLSSAAKLLVSSKSHLTWVGGTREFTEGISPDSKLLIGCRNIPQSTNSFAALLSDLSKDTVLSALP